MTTQQSKGTALITGASTGIGAVYADRLARRGFDLILVARDQQKLDALAARLRKETGRAVSTLKADLTVAADLRTVERRLAEDSRITMLVNNAGVGATAPLLESKVEDLDRMISLNVIALTRLTHAAAPGFAARGNATIINIASIVAIAPEVLNGSYGGSKAYVLALTQSMHKELGDKIRVQAVLPGATSTAFWDVAGTPVQYLPQEIVMTAEDMVDAALAGLDQGEVVTIPSLPDLAEWERFNAARMEMATRLSRNTPAARYLTEKVQ
ncbi:SDR family oxidoreductase [Noviherbaspirillum sp.]|uniref:SDR family NAD(P)-dependent oxidoreductase n=1 Tax=Noviherbaspirillum sp. TaxID=1926288 RepID=UPI002D432EB4|nr:SDR family oxidoreductase [Noviherbaspirillum sp.]HZW20814.1 SDR family oxidoreductase [Noviherbaspirillum sp.]